MSSTQKILWGPTTWTFFHVLAEKINEEFFLKNKNEVLQIIVTISNNLPCPLCSQHARSITSKKNLKIIKNKQDLIRFLNYFHNSVNMRNGKQLFHMKDMDKYKNINFQIAIHNFLTFYTKSYNISSFRLSLDSSQTNRKRIAKNIITWLNKYWRYLN
jgi:hypothetical protein